MKYDGTFSLAVGASARTKSWKNTNYTWSDFVRKIREGHKTNETYKEFLASSKEDQTKIKDVGGYVGGYLTGGKRNPQNVSYRQLVTLDVDFAYAHFWEDYCMQFSNAALIHGTHTHHPDRPRYRLIFPLSREVTPDEYVALSRKIAGTIGIDIFDSTTFQTNRLMFWPSVPKDMDYYFESQDGEWVDVDAVLSTYKDWKDSSQWPTASRDNDALLTNISKQEDPCEKRGVIGAFCRAYTVTDAMETFLTKEYVNVSEERYTYLRGTTASGLISYDEKFTYSHHGTDPTGGRLCNVFDLVRIHLFGHLDGEGDRNKSVSFNKMQDFARNDKRVKAIIARENIETSNYDFAEPFESENDETQEADNIEWMQDLEMDAKSKYTSTAVNLNLIFKKDVRLKNLFRKNVFEMKDYVFQGIPWRRVNKPEPMRNIDFSGVRNYIETIYGITGNTKIEDSLALEIEKKSFHPVKEYLSKLQWDGKARVDELMIDYFGAEDTPYTREAIRKTLVGAVARVFRPGVKFELILTLIGKQGTGKSTFFETLGKDWFSNSFTTIHGKESFEQLQGCWIVEVAELAGLKKADAESIKQYFSKMEDYFRPAYGRTPETFKRQNIFVATSNTFDIIKDSTGGRRFNPIVVNPDKVTKSVWDDLGEEVDQIWAEAVQLFKKGETLYLGAEAEVLAKIKQREHSESDERQGLFEAYLNTRLPESWDKLNLPERRDFIKGIGGEFEETFQREYVCIAEIWCECMGKDKEDMSRYKTREINDILRAMEGWEQVSSTKNFSIYGKQKYYKRVREVVGE